MKRILFSLIPATQMCYALTCCLFCLLITIHIQAQEIKERFGNTEERIEEREEINLDNKLSGNWINNQQMIYRERSYKSVKATNSLPQRTLNINPLGLLQFGPIVQCEFAVSEKGDYLVPSIRVPYLGFLYHVLVIDGEDDVTVSPAALGIGLGYKKLFPKSNGAWYVGGFMEYSFGSSSGGPTNRFESTFSYLNLMANGGYRWRKPESKFVLSVGAYLGPSIALKDESMEPGRVVDERASTIFGMAELSLGWEFSKKTN